MKRGLLICSILCALLPPLAYAANVLEYAERTCQSVHEQYRLPAASTSDLPGAALLVITNRSSLIATRCQFLASLLSLRTLAGLEDEELLLSLVP